MTHKLTHKWGPHRHKGRPPGHEELALMPDETVDLSGRVDAREQRVTRVEAMTEAVTAIRADVATIAQGIDPALAGHVAELADTVETAGCWLGCSTTSSGPSWAPAAPRPTGRGRCYERIIRRG